MVRMVCHFFFRFFSSFFKSFFSSLSFSLFLLTEQKRCFLIGSCYFNSNMVHVITSYYYKNSTTGNSKKIIFLICVLFVLSYYNKENHFLFFWKKKWPKSGRSHNERRAFSNPLEGATPAPVTHSYIHYILSVYLH